MNVALYPWLVPYYQQLMQTLHQGVLPHALLFRSDQGLGVEQLVDAVSHRLLCTQPQGDEPCGQCHSCHLFSAGNHPDYARLAPIENKDIGVEQVREINEKVTQHAQQNGNKVVVIQGAERLTEAAANALLKTLEEPRPNTYFLLQVDIAASLLATIHSRCQSWLINTPPQAVAMAWLQEQSAQEISEIQTALLVSYGRPLAALTMLTQGLLTKRKDFLRQFWVFYVRRSPLELLPYFENELLFQQLDWLAGFLSDALKAKLGIRQGWICQDVVRGIEQFNQKQTALGLLRANQIISQVRSDLLQINGVNQELMLLDGLTKLVTEVFEENNKQDFF